MKKRGLGRGLDALLTNDEENQAPSKTSSNLIAIDQLSPGSFQPRKIFNQESINELADSIKVQGIIQPIIVRMIANNEYEIIAGERRWQAAKIAQLKEVPVVVKDISNSTALAMALIENIQREDLNVIEEARGTKRLIDEFDITHEEAAKLLGKSRTAISNVLRLLNLSGHVQDALQSKKIEMGHARAILSLSHSEQTQLCQKIINRKLSVREVEKIISDNNQNKGLIKFTKDNDIKRLENDLSEKLGLTVSINHKQSGKGSINLQYSNLDELDRIIANWKKLTWKT